jgi:hypothetical protein
MNAGSLAQVRLRHRSQLYDPRYENRYRGVQAERLPAFLHPPNNTL